MKEVWGLILFTDKGVYVLRVATTLNNTWGTAVRRKRSDCYYQSQPTIFYERWRPFALRSVRWGGGGQVRGWRAGWCARPHPHIPSTTPASSLSRVGLHGFWTPPSCKRRTGVLCQWWKDMAQAVLSLRPTPFLKAEKVFIKVSLALCSSCPCNAILLECGNVLKWSRRQITFSIRVITFVSYRCVVEVQGQTLTGIYDQVAGRAGAMNLTR